MLVSGFLIFLPGNVLEILRLDSFKSNFGGYVGFTFLSSGALLTISLAINIGGWIKNRWEKSNRLSATVQRLQHLDSQEKAVLREFFCQGQNTIQLPISQTVVAGLLEKGILCRVGTLLEKSVAGFLSPVQITENIRNLITFELIDIPVSFQGEPNPIDIEIIQSSRPEFIQDIEEHNNTFHTSWMRRRIPF